MQSGGRVKAVRSNWFLAKFWRENQQDLLVGMLGCERPGSSMTKMNNYKNGVARLNWSDGWGSARCGEQNSRVTKCSWHLVLLFPASPWLLLNPGALSIYPMAQEPISGSYTVYQSFHPALCPWRVTPTGWLGWCLVWKVPESPQSVRFQVGWLVKSLGSHFSLPLLRNLGDGSWFLAAIYFYCNGLYCHEENSN